MAISAERCDTYGWTLPPPLLLAIAFLSLASLGQAQVLSGSYAGDGTSNRPITGLGFRPDIVIISSAENGLSGVPPDDNRRTVIRTSTMTLSKSLIYNNDDPLADRIQSLDADGFTVGHPSPEVGEARYTCVNHTGVTYYWVAFKAAPGELKLGTYTGNFADDRNILGVGFQPDYVIAMLEGVGWSYQRSSAMAGDVSYQFEGGSGPNFIQALLPDGFQVGDSWDVNCPGCTFHYAAWKATPGKMSVGVYTGDGLDARSITGLGFRPEYVVIPNRSVQKSAATGPTADLSLVFRCYNNCSVANHIQALEADGFQLGDDISVNNNTAPNTYYWAAFGSGDCPPLGTSGTAGTITVSAPGSFELSFEADYGGGIEKFYDLAQDPTKLYDLAGGPAGSGIKTLHKFSVLSGGTWYHPDDNTADPGDPRWSGAGPKMDLLEATPTRVKVRHDAFYQQLNGSAILAGIKGVGDYTVYSSGRVALRWNRRNSLSTTVPVTDQDVNMGVRSECPFLGAACTDLDVFSDVGVLTSGVVSCPCPPGGPAGSNFLLAQREVAGRTTDFLRILYQDWGLANRSEYDETVAQILWRDNPTTGSIAAGASEIWNTLTYFKPTNLVNHIDPAVTRRSDDYRGPDSLSINIGGPWNDVDENTGSDDFNESEAAYLLTFDMTNGLDIQIDGATTNRFHPFFKIRQWRSLQDPPSVTLQAVPLTTGVDYQADVKPISRGHFAQDLLWHSTLQDLPSLDTTPDVGTPGTVSGTVNFVAARYGNGADVTTTTSFFNFPTAVNFDSAKGAIEFWYKPTYASNDGANHTLGGYNFNGANNWLFTKDNANNLTFSINALAIASQITASPAQYSWRASEWVHLRFEWDDTLPVADQLKIFVNGVEPNPGGGTGSDYVAATNVSANFQIGRRSPSGGSTGVYDEVFVYGGSAATPTALANGGLSSSASESLASTTNNFVFGFGAGDGARRGEYLYLGADSKFRGLNVALATAGAGSPNLQWQYWNGTAWTDLEVGFSFNDETSHLTKSGTISWTDPFGWSSYSINGGPDLYYVRASLASGSYTTSPRELVIKTDILLFQYCGDITANSQRFVFAVPAPTAVDLASFEARALSGAVELSWKTASELDNLGFHLHRSTSAGGPYERITANLIPGLGSSPAGASYRYVDAGLENGRTYYYKLEDVETTGKSELHGPVMATPRAEAPPSASSGEAALSYGDPDAVSYRILEKTARGLVLELRTGGFRARVDEDGTVKISIPGFTEEQDAGAPSIPVMRTWLDAVAGKSTRLESVSEEEVEVFSSLRPSPAGTLEIAASPRGAVRARRTRARGEGAWFHGPGFFPERAARVLSEGYQGEERKLFLELAPLRWNRATEELVFARRLVVRLAFAGREAGHRERGAHEKRSILKRLATRHAGLYRVSFEQVMGARRRSVDASSLRLSRLGEPVAFHIEPRDEVFGPGSTLYFLSDGERSNPYGREAVFEVATGDGGKKMEVISARPAGPPVSVGWRRLEKEENRYYQAGLLEAEDLWLWDLLLAPSVKSYSFELGGLAATVESSQITVWLQGTSDFPASPDHRLRISVNGTPLAEAWLEGKKSLRLVSEVPAGVLREGTNALEVENAGGTGAPYSMVMLDRFEIRYPSRVSAVKGFWEGELEESGAVDLEGVREGAAVLEVQNEPRWLAGAAASIAGLRFSVESGGRYVAVSPEALLSPTMRTVPSSSLKSRSNGADYVVIGPRSFLEAARPLLDLRRSQGLRTLAVAIEEVYSEFGYGEARPDSVREFVSYAHHHWRKPSPRYLLLLGDATYDFKDYLKTGVANQVPPLLVKTSYLWTASDPTYAMVNGEDILPDLAVGRLPAASVDEVRVMVAKILAHEGRQAPPGPTVLVADNPDEAGDFEADSDEIARGVLASRDPKKIYLSRLGVNETRNAIVRAFDSGASLFSYVGHGGIHLWAHENLFNTSRVAGLATGAETPVLLTLNCLNGYFHFPYFGSLAEELVKAKDKGAVAAFSPSGLSLNEPAHVFHRALLEELVSGRHERLGDAVLAAQADYAETGFFPELLRIYHLIGDPALRLR